MSSVNSLEYQDIRNSIVNFLRQDPYFKDFNFEASNFSRLINIMAYTSMYNGYYMKMLLDESMPDSAHTKTSLIGHANNRNYLTKFITASKSIINVKVDAELIDTNEVPYIQILKGQQFKGTNRDSKSIYFVAPYTITLLYKEESNSYEGNEFMLLQGQYRTQTYDVLDSFKKYQISDSNCDDTTVIVKIKSSKTSDQAIEYIRNRDFYNVDKNDLCYYITASTNNIYQIHFGHNNFGREPRPGEVIEISYLKTDGSSANDTSKFELSLAKKPTTENTNINFYKPSAISVTTSEASKGGLDEESIDELRFNVLNFTRQRGRAVTPDDIKSIIISEFRDIDSINVWSGGNAKYRRYGKTYISIKPKTGELLTSSARQVISDMMINQYGILSKTDLIFVDPNFTDILMTVKFKLDRSITSDNSATVRSQIESLVSTFNKTILSKFDVNYYDSDLNTYIKDANRSIITVFTQKQIQKTLILNYVSGRFLVNFGNPIKSIISNEFPYGNQTCTIVNDNNVVNIINSKNEFIAKIGSIDLLTGDIDINIPQYVSIESLNLIADPVYPDINTLEDNIVRIKTINVSELV